MRRRSFFRTLLAALAVPFVAKAVGPQTTLSSASATTPTAIPLNEQLGVDFDWSQIPELPGLMFLAEFPAEIEAMETIKTNGGDDMLLVLAGGLGYLVDQRGTVTRL